jgi:hypothetical protein
MKIDRRMKLAVPIERGDGSIIWVHSEPISREVFERYYLVIAQAFAEIYGMGLSWVAGPSVAALTLKGVAQRLGQWEGPDGVENGLMAEIRRLSNVIVPTERGWETTPLDLAEKDGSIDEGDRAEIEGVVVFFIVASSMHKRSDLATILAGVSKTWDAVATSSNCTEFARSLKTSTEGENTGEKAAG